MPLAARIADALDLGCRIGAVTFTALFLGYQAGLLLGVW